MEQNFVQRQEIKKQVTSVLSSKVLIIGAGVSGLSTAALLANENIECKVFEKYLEFRN